MTIRVVSPAPLADVIELYAAARPLKRLEFKAAVLQAARSESIGFYNGNVMLAAAMLYPAPPERDGADLRELAFHCRPEMGNHLVALIRTARAVRAKLQASLGPRGREDARPHGCEGSRLTAAARPDDPPLRIRAIVRTGHRPGERLARLCGLRPVKAAGLDTRWELNIVANAAGGTRALELAGDGKIRGRDQVAVRRRRRKGSAGGAS